ncbi:MAG: PAS domain-containing sensor histidine kinase, partial [Gemmatimonadota bacterium]|nr:PAS domain-containing sensor histidine kinase [Gemmatimonadota bacterium]
MISDNAPKTHSDESNLAPPESRDLRSAERLYRLLVSSVRDYAIFAMDPTGHIVSWNTGAERIKGYKPEEIIGQHFSVFYPPQDVAAGKTTWELEVATREGRVEDEGWRIRKDGTRFWASVVITALRDEDGRLVGFAKVTRDLTERRAAQQREIADARRVAEAEAANRAKSEFLTMMSHELRTPLNAIAGYVDLLALGIGGKLSGEQQDYVTRIRRSQQHLLTIISDLLDFGRIEAGEVAYDIGPVVLSAVIDGVEPMIKPQAVARRVTIDRHACVRGVVALADRARVEQILLNLLSNAVKFTGAGGQVTVSCRATGRGVMLSVRDTGIGIEPDKLEAIFEPFVQLGRSLTTNHEGTGLGLAIGRNLARAMGGDLAAESTPGKG